MTINIFRDLLNGNKNSKYISHKIGKNVKKLIQKSTYYFEQFLIKAINKIKYTLHSQMVRAKS